MPSVPCALYSELLNVGTGIDLPIYALAMLVKKIVGYEGDIIWDTTKPDGTPQKLLDLSRMKKLGWEATTRLEQGIKKSYKWYVDQTADCEG